MNLPTFKQEEFLPVAVVAFFLFIILVGLCACKSVAGNIHQNKEQRQAYIQETLNLKKLISAASQKKFIKLASPNRLDEFKDKISKIAADNNVRLIFKKSNDEAPSDTNSFNRILFEVQTSGKFQDFGKFLSQLKTMPEGLVDVDKAVMSTEGQASSANTSPIQKVKLVT